MQCLKEAWLVYQCVVLLCSIYYYYEIEGGGSFGPPKLTSVFVIMTLVPHRLQYNYIFV